MTGDRSHAPPCDYGLTYGNGGRGRCTCGLVAEELTADQLIRVIALRVAAERTMDATPSVVKGEAQIFERYIRGDQ